MKMRERKDVITSGLCALLTGLVMASGCGYEKADAPSVTTARAVTEEHGDDDGHGHGPAVAPSASIEERVSAHCECGVPIYQCEECRYEVGVVKLDASLMKQADGSGLVRKQTVALTEVVVSLPATGEVALNENATVHISPRVSGIIESVSADIGAHVNAGDTLLALVSVDLGRALADYERNRTLSELTEKVVERETKLKEQNVSSEQDLIEAQMIFEQHRTDLKASEQMLHVLGLTDEDMKAVREPAHDAGSGRLFVRAPMAGTIIEKHAVSGEIAEAGQELMLLSDLSTAWVWANVYSRDLERLLAAEKQGPVAVEVTVSAFSGRKFKGMLDYVGATMNEQTRTVKVRAAVDNADLALRPGMFCEADIAIGNGRAEAVLAVPSAALFADEGKSFVFKHWKEDFYIRQDVRKGREFFGMVEILEGLQAGDDVVTEGGFLLKSDVLREKMGAGCAD